MRGTIGRLAAALRTSFSFLATRTAYGKSDVRAVSSVGVLSTSSSGLTRLRSRIGERFRRGYPVSGPRRPQRGDQTGANRPALKHIGTVRLMWIVSGRVGRQSVSWDDPTDLLAGAFERDPRSRRSHADLLALLFLLQPLLRLALPAVRSASSFLSLAAASSPSSHVLSTSGCSTNVDVVFPGDP